MPEVRVCPKCGSENSLSSKFCFNCGTSLSAKSKSQPEQTAKTKKKKQSQENRYHSAGNKKRQTQSGRAFEWIIAGLLITGAITIYLFINMNSSIGNDNPRQDQIVYEQRSNDLALENSVYRVASKFSCSCGSCGEEPLETCTCPTAQKERQFIREALQRGKQEAEVVDLVEKAYGYLKQ